MNAKSARNARDDLIRTNSHTTSYRVARRIGIGSLWPTAGVAAAIKGQTSGHIAASQVHAAETLWQANRPRVPGAIRAEIARASSLVARRPRYA
jgi:hypothetical protein